ncbi:hypothetical protein B566_EDAN008833 [Ephemera danica]|nr:hypothetical protein B566_EDAN008833 [Ephemera danica]
MKIVILFSLLALSSAYIEDKSTDAMMYNYDFKTLDNAVKLLNSMSDLHDVDLGLTENENLMHRRIFGLRNPLTQVLHTLTAAAWAAFQPYVCGTP